MDMREKAMAFIRSFAVRARRPLAPGRIVRGVVRTAKRSSRKWGCDYKSEVPNRYRARASVRDWAEYYGVCAESIAVRVARRAEERLLDKGLSFAGRIEVEIVPDPEVRFGRVSVDAWFDEGSPAGAEGADAAPATDNPTKRPGADAPERAQDGLSGFPEVRKGGLSNGEESADDGRHSAESSQSTGAATAAVASFLSQTIPRCRYDVEAALVGESRRCRVYPGTTVGVVRRSQGELVPGIPLPIKDYPAVSQIQGAFLFKGGRWSFRQMGRNGTVVEGDGVRVVLDTGDEARLEDGSVLKFADGKPLAFRITAREPAATPLSATLHFTA